MSSAASSMSSSSASPSPLSGSAAISDLLASLSDSAVSLQSTLSPAVAAEVLRAREEQRKKISAIADHLKEVVQPNDVLTTLNGVFILSSQPSLLPSSLLCGPPSADLSIRCAVCTRVQSRRSSSTCRTGW